ncbi:MAG: hypothetical protein GQ564_23225 [Bacteroidales bacterium]|nr:hypothetical protein [Bacteroidales bacterium]
MQKFNFSHIILFLFIFINSNVVIAQEKGLILSKYYSPKDYNANTQNWCIAQDSRGVLYFANNEGILEYDGETWRLIKITNNSHARSFAFDENDILYTGAYGQMGFLSPDVTGNLNYKSLNHLVDSSHKDIGEVWDVSCYSDTVFFFTDRYIYRYHNNTFDYWESKDDQFLLPHKLGNSFLVQEMGKGLFELVNDSLVLIDKGEFFTDIMIHSILPLGNNLLICSRYKGLFIYSKSGNKTTIKSFSDISSKTKNINKYFIDNGVYHGIEISDSIYAISSRSNSILIIDNNWNIIDVINHETIGIKSPINYFFHQKDQSLWLALDNGISQVEILSPYRYWNDDRGIHGNFSDIAKIKNNLYVCTLSGVFLTNSQNTSNTELNTFKPVQGTFGQTWAFLYFQPPVSKQNDSPFKDSKISNRITTDKTLLLVSTNRGLFQIKGDKSILVSDYKKVFLSYQYKKDPNVLFLGLAKGIAMLTYKDGKWKDHGLKFGISDMIRDINEDTLGNLWLNAAYKGLYRIENPSKPDLDFNEIEYIDTSHNLSPINKVGFWNYKDTLIFTNKNKNNFTYNSENNIFELYEMQEDAFEEIDTSQQNNFNDTLSYYRIREDQLTDPYVINDQDPNSWFGANMGLCRYNYSQHRNLLDVSPTIIRKVIASDSLIFNGTNYRKLENHADSSGLDLVLNSNPIIDNNYILEYNNNSLKFFFSSPYFEEESKNTYSYYLSNFNSKWSDWDIESKKEYTNLREGDYIFKVKSKNIYNIETPVAEFKFTILPPWYRTFGAFIGYFVFGILFIILIVKLYTYKLIKEKDNLENIVIERTQEILMQKEEIIVQSEHLKDANDVIVARNEELENQKLEIEAQRDTLAVSNATKNKFFRIIAHDLRNPISTLSGSTNLIFNSFEDFSEIQTKEFIGDLNKLAQTTFNLLENLLDWSSTQMGEIKFLPKPIDIKSLTAENLELISPKINSKKIELKINIKKDTIAFADENMVKTVIRNLLSNAVKFTPENGKIEISCKLKTDYLIYSVKDSGIGINEDDLKKLFRIDAHHTTPGLSNEKGSGLGLILCQEFVEKNGGTISITSEQNKGTSIDFTLKKYIS